MQRNDGLLVGYHCVQYQNLRLPPRSTRYPRAPPRLWEIDMSTHCYVDSLPSLAYVGSFLMSPESGWWVVYYTERTAKIACFILWDVYDRHKLWWVPARLILWMRELDLTRVLGSPVNAEDFAHLLCVVEDTDWSTGEVMDTQAGGNSRTRTAGDENTAIGDAEFIWYDPWSRARIDERTATTLRSAEGRRVRPEGHPVGYGYNPPLPPIAVQALSWAQSVIQTMPSSQFCEKDDGAIVFAGGVSHRRSGMVLDDRASKQRRIAPQGRAGSRIADQSASGRAGPSSDVGAVVGQVNTASDAALVLLRSQLETLIHEQRARANAVAAPAAAGENGDATVVTAADAQMTEAASAEVVEVTPAPADGDGAETDRDSAMLEADPAAEVTGVPGVDNVPPSGDAS